MFGPTSANRGHRLFLAGADALAVVGAGILAAWIRFPSHLFSESIREIVAHPWFVISVIGAVWALSTTFDLYRPEAWPTLDRLMVRLAALAVTLPVAIALFVYAVPPWRFGRGLLVLTVLLTLAGSALVRMYWRARAVHWVPRPAVVIGHGPVVESLSEELEHHPAPPFRIVRRLEELPEDTDPESVRSALGGAELVIVAQLADPETWDRLAALNFSGTTVIDAPGAFAQLTGRIPIRQVDARWFIASGDFTAVSTSAFHHVQRFLDLVGASLLLLLALPVFTAAALAVLLTSGRPILYRQERLGRFRRPFTLFKLRTMSRDAEKDGPRFAASNDSRVLPVGRFCRRWRIDEIPQLLNVIRGEMSLVGPRPERPEVARELERLIPFYAFRYSVRPGITGWAQVNHNYCVWPEDHALKLEYDLYSLRHHGPGLYALVLLRTLGALVFRPGR